MWSQLLALPALAVASAPVYSSPGPVPRSDSRADDIKEAFSHAWDGYYEYAFPHDELHPISNGYGDSRNSWGASAVDALSTAIIMRNATIVNQIIDHIAVVDYSKTETIVSLFETTIRYLAGMLSGYDLLKGPAAGLVDEGKVDVLLEQSRNLADNLKFAFDTPSGVPYNMINITSGGNNNATTNGLAVTGTLVLEWTRLSDLTGDDEYARLSQRAQDYLLHPSPPEYEPFPGLVGGLVNIADGKFANDRVSWNGGADSYYEYLIKMYLYDPERFGLYRERWVAAAESTIEHLASHPSTREDLTFLASYSGKDGLTLASQHLTCFDGGSFLLGGTLLDRQDFVDFGLDLVTGCHETYSATLTGIGPEQFGWDPKAVPENQQELFERAGFYIKSGSYILRPEVIESFYYAWRITGDETVSHEIRYMILLTCGSIAPGCGTLSSTSTSTAAQTPDLPVLRTSMPRTGVVEVTTKRVSSSQRC
ncbi:glycoside hydrolase [Aspergillus varians]